MFYNIIYMYYVDFLHPAGHFQAISPRHRLKLSPDGRCILAVHQRAIASAPEGVLTRNLDAPGGGHPRLKSHFSSSEKHLCLPNELAAAFFDPIRSHSKL